MPPVSVRSVAVMLTGYAKHRLRLVGYVPNRMLKSSHERLRSALLTDFPLGHVLVLLQRSRHPSTLTSFQPDCSRECGCGTALRIVIRNAVTIVRHGPRALLTHIEVEQGASLAIGSHATGTR